MKRYPELEKIGPIYARLMEEIKLRVAVTELLILDEKRLPAISRFEICYLQLRKIVEVFALACLAAHGDVPQVKSKLLQKTYDADKIIKELGRLHPSFYPIPSKQIKDPITGKIEKVENIQSGYLTKEELLSLYGECGNYLHRGSIRQLLTKWGPDLNFERIKECIRKISILLNHHQIQTIHPKIQFWIIMQAEHDDKVHWYIMEEVINQQY